MSTIVAATLSNGTVSTSTANCIQGSAKAWVNFNGVTIVTVNGSFNVSSVTRNGAGDYTVTFTTAMPNVNYSVVAAAGNNSSVFGSDINLRGDLSSASATRFQTGFVNNNVSTSQDSLYVSVAIFR